jgi:glycosyltransferase involved in cell wall biosynthesis
MIKFSILIANYNNGKYFRDCHASFISQTYKNWEAIIIDDGSTDNSFEVISNLIKEDSRFKIYQNITNKGCGFTKRRCMEYATGDICGYVDPDDALSPDAIECSVNAFKDHPEIVATYSQMIFCNQDLVSQNIFNKTKQIYNERLFFNCPVQFTHLFTFKREIYLKTTGINPLHKNAVDQDLYLKILEFGEALFIKKSLYKYRIHPDGISQYDSKDTAKASFAQIILETMHRRGVKKINGRIVPKTFNQPNEIFDLLEYQNSFLYRSKTKIITFFQYDFLPIMKKFWSIFQL